MILSPRGTSGSGKTTLARIVLDGTGVYGAKTSVYVAGRRKPMYYVREPLPGSFVRPIAVLGSYESATGGADTISSNQIPFDLMRQLHDRYDVLCEGLLHSAEQHRTAALHADGFDVRLFYFDLPLETCLDGVRARRAARGNLSPLNPETTASRWRTLRLHPPRFRAMGVSTTTGDRRAGVEWLLECGVAHPSDPTVERLLSGGAP